jgi:hypothetical protein
MKTRGLVLLCAIATVLCISTTNALGKTAGCPCSPCKCSPCTCGGAGSKSGGGKHHEHHGNDHSSSVGVGGTIDFSRVGHHDAEPDPFAAGGGEKPVAHTEEKRTAKHKDHEPKTSTFDDIMLTGKESKGDMPPSDTFNVDNRTGGSGNQAAGGKGKGNAAATVCSDCASPTLTVTYDSQTNEVKTGPYGATSMGKPPYDLTVEGGCITCGKDNICCCAITKISVVLHFQINVNTDKIDKGVWMNTSDDPKKLGKTKTAAPKDSDKDKDEWKKVDKDSVVKHEKTHCDDLRKAIEDNLKEGLKGNAFTPSSCPDKDCKQDNDACKKVLNDAKANIDTRMNANIDVVVKQLTEMEKEGYPGGEMEQNARKAQAKDLNDRNK